MSAPTAVAHRISELPADPDGAPVEVARTPWADRVLALGGVGWAVLFVVSFGLAGTEPAGDAPIAEIRNYFASWPAAATVLYALAGVGLVGYLAVLATRLLGSSQRALAATAVVGATVFVILQAAGDVAFLSLTRTGGAGVGEEQARSMLQLHEMSHALQPYLMAAMVIGAGVLAVETRVFARWLGWAGIGLGACLAVVGTATLAGVAGFGHDSEPAIAAFFGFIAWVGATSVSLARRA